jgi:hypothetical protein
MPHMTPLLVLLPAVCCGCCARPGAAAPQLLTDGSGGPGSQVHDRIQPSQPCSGSTLPLPTPGPLPECSPRPGGWQQWWAAASGSGGGVLAGSLVSESPPALALMPSAGSSSLRLDTVAAAPLPALQLPQRQCQSRSSPQQAALPAAAAAPAAADGGLASAVGGDASASAPGGSEACVLPGISDVDLDWLLEELGGCSSPSDDFLA